MDVVECKLTPVAEKLLEGEKDVRFLSPWAGCSKEEMVDFLEEKTGKSISLELGFSFEWFANIVEGK